jgi:hypothetical protein
MIRRLSPQVFATPERFSGAGERDPACVLVTRTRHPVIDPIPAGIRVCDCELIAGNPETQSDYSSRPSITVSTECQVEHRSFEQGDCQFRHAAALELSRPLPGSKRSNDDHLLGKERIRAGGGGPAIHAVSLRSGSCVNR